MINVSNLGCISPRSYLEIILEDSPHSSDIVFRDILRLSLIRCKRFAKVSISHHFFEKQYAHKNSNPQILSKFPNIFAELARIDLSDESFNPDDVRLMPDFARFTNLYNAQDDLATTLDVFDRFFTARFQRVLDGFYVRRGYQ